MLSSSGISENFLRRGGSLHVHKSLLLIAMLRQMNPIHTTPPIHPKFIEILSWMAILFLKSISDLSCKDQFVHSVHNSRVYIHKTLLIRYQDLYGQ
jgi:hypothetical protein